MLKEKEENHNKKRSRGCNKSDTRWVGVHEQDAGDWMKWKCRTDGWLQIVKRIHYIEIIYYNTFFNIKAFKTLKYIYFYLELFLIKLITFIIYI